jgi:hypothetical protein
VRHKGVQWRALDGVNEGYVLISSEGSSTARQSLYAISKDPHKVDLRMGEVSASKPIIWY